MNDYGAPGIEARLYDTEYATLDAAGPKPDVARDCLLRKDLVRLVD
ncbi:MAG: hypothetical protein V4723_03045 [Pseudomonadota bacterium]